jgi:hypothetical protein
MRHTRDEVIKRTIAEHRRLDRLVASLSEADWKRLLPRPETKDPWTVKDGLAHVIYWKANFARRIRGERRPPEERGLEFHELNHVIYARWRRRPPREVVSWHREVQKDLLAALRAAPAKLFSGKPHAPDWPYDLDGHSAFHRVKDIERALARDKAQTRTTRRKR